MALKVLKRLYRVQWVRKHVPGCYRAPYLASLAIYKASRLVRRRTLEPEYDLVFIVAETTRGWILEAICKEIAAYYPGRCCLHYATVPPPRARAYFFSHYSMLPRYLVLAPFMRGSRILVFYTHPRELPTSETELAYAFNQATYVICMSSMAMERLKCQGISRDRLTYIVGAADPKFFHPHRRDGGVVGFCTAYYDRKRPDRILEIVKALPHRQFILLGRGWEAYPQFEELKALPNFTYATAPYAEYPSYYARMDVFVSPAMLEGGPIPMIESMMSNVVPVASRTGFAPDIITHGKNGFLFDVDAQVEEISELIDHAFELDGDVRATIAHLSWKNMAERIRALAEGTDRAVGGSTETKGLGPGLSHRCRIPR